MVAGAAARTGRRTEHRADRARRRRVRAARMLRFEPRHADLRRLGRAWASLPQLPHDRPLLADALVPHDRAQPSRERHGPRHRSRHGVPGIRRAHPEGEPVPARSAGAARVRGVGGRQVAPDTGRRGESRGPPRSMAAGPRLRAFLRVLRRRDAPERARARVRQPLRRRATCGCRRLLPHRGSRRPRERVRPRPAARRPGQALLPLLVPRRVPLAAPSATGVDREVSRPFRRRLGRVPRGDAQSPDRGGLVARVDGVVGTSRVGSGVGRARRRRAARLRALHGSVRGLSVTHRPRSRSPARRVGRDGRPRQHGRRAVLRQRRKQ